VSTVHRWQLLRFGSRSAVYLPFSWQQKKGWRPPDDFTWSASVISAVWHCWSGRHKQHPACMKLLQLSPKVPSETSWLKPGLMWSNSGKDKPLYKIWTAVMVVVVVLVTAVVTAVQVVRAAGLIWLQQENTEQHVNVLIQRWSETERHEQRRLVYTTANSGWSLASCSLMSCNTVSTFPDTGWSSSR